MPGVPTDLKLSWVVKTALMDLVLLVPAGVPLTLPRRSLISAMFSITASVTFMVSVGGAVVSSSSVLSAALSSSSTVSMLSTVSSGGAGAASLGLATDLSVLADLGVASVVSWVSSSFFLGL